MTTPDPVSDPVPPAADSHWPAVRLAAAWLLTMAVLPYAWARTLVVTLLTGMPEARFVAMLIGGMAAVVVLAGRLPAKWSAAGRRKLWIGLLLPWLAVNAGVVLYSAGDGLPVGWVIAVYLPQTLWVLWAAWMHAAPLGMRVRWGGLAGLVVLCAAGVGVLRTDGLTGDDRVDFAWRQSAPAAAEPPATGAEAADLARATADDFPQFLGPYRLGVLPAAGLDPDWSARAPKMVWRRSVGAGWGGFAVVGGFAVSQEQHGDEECVVCRRVADGRVVWSFRDPVSFDSSLGGPGPRATPAIVGGRVYAIGATGRLHCLDGADGRAIWTVDTSADNGGQPIRHGVCGSPMVVDGLVVVCPNGAPAVMAAYDAKTGKRVWQAVGDTASYGSPLVADVAGERQILVYGAAGPAGYAVADGRKLWSHAWSNHHANNCSQPIPDAGAADRVLVSTGYDKGSVLLEIGPASAGRPVKALWESRAMKTKFTTAVIRDGCVYGLDDGILACMSLADGRRLWKAGRYGHGQILLAGGLLLVQAENGEVVLVEAASDGHKELGRIPALSGKTWNNPALAGRFLLVRNDRTASCWELPLKDR